MTDWSGAWIGASGAGEHQARLAGLEGRPVHAGAARRVGAVTPKPSLVERGEAARSETCTNGTAVDPSHRARRARAARAGGPRLGGEPAPTSASARLRWSCIRTIFRRAR